MAEKGYTIIGGPSSEAATFPPQSLSVSYLKDEFRSGGPGSPTGAELVGQFSKLGWSINNANFTNRLNSRVVLVSVGSNDLGAGIATDHANHPGAAQILIPNGSAGSAGEGMIYGPADGNGTSGGNTGFAYKEKTWRSRFIFRVCSLDDPYTALDPISVTDLAIVFMGFTAPTNTLSTSIPGFGLWWNLDEHANWRVKYMDDAGDDFYDDTGVAPDANWHLLEFRHTGGTDDYDIYLDDALVSTVTFDTPNFFGPNFMRWAYFRVGTGAPSTAFYEHLIGFYDELITGLSQYTPA